MFSFFCFLFLLSYSLSNPLSESTDHLAILGENISEDSCEFYTKVEEMRSCGPDGYVENFASKYCQAYLIKRDEFSDKKWQNGVRVCLQENMLSKLRDFPDASCDQIKTWGFGSHFGCYMHPIPHSPEINFCHIPKFDMIKVGSTAIGALIEKEVRAQFKQMSMECLGQWSQDAMEDAGIYIKKLMNTFGWE